jgi:hypothetical protein
MVCLECRKVVAFALVCLCQGHDTCFMKSVTAIRNHVLLNFDGLIITFKNDKLRLSVNEHK